jgi:hypothetical protein
MPNDAGHREARFMADPVHPLVKPGFSFLISFILQGQKISTEGGFEC